MKMNPASKWSFIQANNPETVAKLVRNAFLVNCYIFFIAHVCLSRLFQAS